MSAPKCHFCNRRMEWSTRVREWRCDCPEFKGRDTADYDKQRQEED